LRFGPVGGIGIGSTGGRPPPLKPICRYPLAATAAGRDDDAADDITFHVHREGAMLVWCQAISIAMSVVSGVCLFLPAPKIQATCQQEPWEFAYRVVVLPLLTWYGLFAAIAIFVGSFIADASWEESENNVYLMAVVSSAVIVVAMVLLIVLYDAVCCRCCCCGRGACCCTIESCVKSAAARVARRQGAETAQKKILSGLVSTIISAFITPMFASDMSTTTGVMTAVGLTAGLIIIGSIVGDCIADALIYVQFSVMVSVVVVLALFYSITGDWAHRETTVYIKGLIIAAALSIVHLMYDFLLRRCRRRRHVGRVLVSQRDDSGQEEEEGGAPSQHYYVESDQTVST